MYDPRVFEDETILRRQVAEQQDLGVDALLPHRQHEGGAGAEGIAVGTDVRRHEHALGAGEDVDDLLIGVGH